MVCQSEGSSLVTRQEFIAVVVWPNKKRPWSDKWAFPEWMDGILEGDYYQRDEQVGVSADSPEEQSFDDVRKLKTLKFEPGLKPMCASFFFVTHCNWGIWF